MLWVHPAVILALWAGYVICFFNFYFLARDWWYGNSVVRSKIACVIYGICAIVFVLLAITVSTPE